MKKRKTFILILVIIPLMIRNVASGFAQVDSIWSPRQNIPGIANDTWTPILVADRNRTVHAFYSQWVDKGEDKPLRAIMYNQWTMEQGWTPPVDILLSPFKDDARLLDAYLDQSGIMHIIFWGGDNTGANIYYSRADVSDAANARAWLEPILVARNAQDPPNGAFYMDGEGNYNILFSGNQEGSGLYTTKSNDLGYTWSTPTPIYKTQDSKNFVHPLKVFESSTGWIHAIWNEVTLEGQGRRIFYSHEKIGDSQWSEPILLAEADSGYGTNTPNIIEHSGNIYAIYNTDAVNKTSKINMRLSDDGGLTWGNPVVIFPRHVGVSGNLSLVIDSSDTLHLFFIQRIPGQLIGVGSPDIGGIWHSILDDGHWIEPQNLSFADDDRSGSGFAPYEPQAVVSQGNKILLTWMKDPGDEGNGVWYSYNVLDTPELPVEPFTTAQSTNPSISTPLPDKVPAADAMTESVISNQIADTPQGSISGKNSSDNNLGTLFTVGLVPAILVIALIIFVKIKSIRKY